MSPSSVLPKVDTVISFLQSALIEMTKTRESVLNDTHNIDENFLVTAQELMQQGSNLTDVLISMVRKERGMR